MGIYNFIDDKLTFFGISSLYIEGYISFEANLNFECKISKFEHERCESFLKIKVVL